MVSNSVSNAFILSFLLFLSVESAVSRTLDEEIAALPTCSTTCLSKAATRVQCGTGDYACQCQFQETIIGILARVSSQTTCLIGDCGLSNTSATRAVFKRICSILSTSSSSTSAIAAPVASTVQSTSPDQETTPSTSTTETPSSSSSSIDTPSTISFVLSTSLQLQTSIVQTTMASQISVPTSVTQSTIVKSSSSKPIPSATSPSSTSVQSTVEPTPIAVSVSTSIPSPINALSTSISRAIATTTYTSAIMGAAKMSPIAESNYNPIQAGEATPVTPLRQTKPKLGAGAVIGLNVSAVVIVVTILGVSFWFWRKRNMRSPSNRKFVTVEEQAGPRSGARSEKYQVQAPQRVKSLPPHPLSPKTPDLEESSFRGRVSNLTLEFEYKPPPNDGSTRTSLLQPTMYNPSQSLNLSPEPRSFISESNQHRSTKSSFIPSNTAHKSAGSSFFASIPILLDSKEGRCDECLNNQEEYRFARASARISPPVCTCAAKHPPFKTHFPPTTVDEYRGVSGVSTTRSEVEEELLVGRVPTLLSERSSAGLSHDGDWVDELGLERELSKISEENDVKLLRSNPFVLPPRPLLRGKPAVKTVSTLDLGAGGDLEMI